MSRVTPAVALIGATRKSIPWNSTVKHADGGDEYGDDFWFVLDVADSPYQVRVSGRIPERGTKNNTVVVEVGERYGTLGGTLVASVDVSIRPGADGGPNYRVQSRTIDRGGDDPNIVGFLLAAAGGVAVALDRLTLTAPA